MDITTIRTRWREGGAVTNGWLSIPSPLTAEIMAHAGFDSVTIDCQHGMIEVSNAITMLPAISGAGITPLARANWNEPGTIMKLLDAGALGIICPMTNTAADAERFVGACRYPPLGYRSLGPLRASLVYGADYASRANDEVIALPMIETREALDNLDTILAVSGIDGVFVGPSDLSMSLRGRGGFDHEDDEMLAVLQHISAAARAAGKIAGIFTGGAAYSRRMIDLGFQLVTVTNDASLLIKGAAAAVAAMM